MRIECIDRTAPRYLNATKGLYACLLEHFYVDEKDQVSHKFTLLSMNTPICRRGSLDLNPPDERDAATCQACMGKTAPVNESLQHNLWTHTGASRYCQSHGGGLP